jgi:hypothetical protein
MSHTLRSHAAGIAANRHLARDHPASDRERLLDTARQAGLQPDDVVRLAEVLTGRTWDRCGRTEISVIARALLEASSRAASGHSEGARPCAG